MHILPAIAATLPPCKTGHLASAAYVCGRSVKEACYSLRLAVAWQKVGTLLRMFGKRSRKGFVGLQGKQKTLFTRNRSQFFPVKIAFCLTCKRANPFCASFCQTCQQSSHFLPRDSQPKRIASLFYASSPNVCSRGQASCLARRQGCCTCGKNVHFCAHGFCGSKIHVQDGLRSVFRSLGVTIVTVAGNMCCFFVRGCCGSKILWTMLVVQSFSLRQKS